MSQTNTEQEIDINTAVIGISDFPKKRNANGELITSRGELARILRTNWVERSTSLVKAVIALLVEWSDYRMGKGYYAGLILSGPWLENFVRSVNDKVHSVCDRT